MGNDLRRWIILCENAGNIVRVYRGVSQDSHFYTKFGLFFADNRRIAAEYARGRGASGTVIEADLDISNAFGWTRATNRDFQDYVIRMAQGEEVPPGARAALAQYNRQNDVRLSLTQAIGSLLRENPAQVSHYELDPLMGYARDFIGHHDVIIREHDAGGGMRDGIEYIVFSARRLKRVHRA